MAISVIISQYEIRKCGWMASGLLFGGLGTTGSHETEGSNDRIKEPMGQPVTRIRRVILLALSVVAWTAAPAQAQWVVTPHIGASAGDVETGKLLGGNGGVIGGSVDYFGSRLGLELEIERHFHFFQDPDIGDSGPESTNFVDVNTRAMSVMGNMVVPIHITGATNWRPYGAAGLGMIRASFEHEGPDPDAHQNDFAFNVGGGVMYRLNARVGLRGDVRYFRALADEDRDLPPGQIGDLYGVYRDYGFWRWSFGVTLGFPR
jgi:opacity protein-like surface antigen